MKYTIAGKVMDSASQKPVVYATITITDATNNAVASTYSGENGSFKTTIAQAGRYILEISSVGYLTKEISISIKDEPSLVQPNDAYLTPVSGNLAGVTVNSHRRLIEQRPGMLIYNAENDLTNSGGTAADILRKAPVLNVDAQGNVTMRGSGNIKILVNGKYSGQMARSPADALNMMPADMIKAVEVITTPSAKYDAEGAAGVINIITKKGRKEMSGSLGAVVSNWEQAFNPRLSMTKNNWTVKFNGHLHRLGKQSASTLKRTTLENGQPNIGLEQEIDMKNFAPHGSGDLNIVYQPDSVSELSLGINFWFGNWPENYGLTSTVSLQDGSIAEQYQQAVTSSTTYLGSDINIGFNRKLKKPGSEITLLLQTSPSSDKWRYDAVQKDNNDELLYQELNDSKTKNRAWTIQADYIHPLSANGKYLLETGVKMINRNVSNAYDVIASDPQQPEDLVPQPARSDIFKYQQDVFAAYSMLKINMKNNWYVEAGARVEKTFIEGRFTVLPTYFKNEFTNFVPSATVSKKINDKQNISFSYTKRLTRPYIWDLSPNADVSDPKNITTGNPRLQPEMAHQAELVYGLVANADFFLNASLFAKQTDNAMIDFTITDSVGVSLTRKQNLAANRQYGLNLSSTVALSTTWSINGNLNVNHLHFESGALLILNTGWAVELDLNTTFKLPRNYALQAFGEFNSRAVTLQGYETLRYYYSFAAKKEFSASKINLTLALTNPFSKTIPQTEAMNSRGFISRMDNRYYNRAIKLSFSWEFGRMFQQKETKKIVNDDVNDQGKG